MIVLYVAVPGARGDKQHFAGGAMEEGKKAPTDYAERVIVFIDVLGFGALVEASGHQKDRGDPQIQKRIGDAILWSLEDLHELHALKNLMFTQFSDSFVVSCDAGKGQFTLNFFAIAVLSTIDHFLSSGLLLRGGITKGPLIHDGTLLFGPAMNRAYQLESKMAKLPRVILDPELPELSALSEFNGLLSLDKDGLFYVDYFQPRKQFYLWPEYWLALQTTIAAMPRTDQLREKRAWLVEKYNEALRGFSYPDFEKRLLDHVEDLDNNAVVADHKQILSKAMELRNIAD
jgi:hypothetical protein